MPAPLVVRGILFDLDGTLVDSAPDIAHAANNMLSTLGEPLATSEQIRTWIGNGIQKLVKRALCKSFNGEPDEDLFNKALPVFLTHYEHNVCVDSYLYAGVPETLTALHSQGFILACVTNKIASCSLPLLNQLGISHYFSSIVSGDTCKHKKPHPEPIQFGIKEMGLQAEECVFVGDSVHDILAAHVTGIPAIAVSYGYNQGLNLNDSAPYITVDHFTDIPSLLLFNETVA